MNITMSGIDFHTSGLDIREKFHVSESAAGSLARKIKCDNGLSGCVVLSTCNRTEVYVSAADGSLPNPGEMLARSMGCENFEEYEKYFICRAGDEAVVYLMEMSSGIHSQIFGDDQIISQVKKSLVSSREEKAADPYLETLFRNAVTAAKRVKTEVKLTSDQSSVAAGGVMKLVEFFSGHIAGKRGLVIGNGEMGRLAAADLVRQGGLPTVTIREYKYKPVIVPEGCDTVRYGQRFNGFENYDFVVSATTSPHFTVTLEDIKDFVNPPEVFLDLAVPRDIDPRISDLGLTLYDMDSLGESRRKSDLSEVHEILSIYKRKFYDWVEFRDSGTRPERLLANERNGAVE